MKSVTALIDVGILAVKGSVMTPEQLELFAQLEDVRQRIRTYKELENDIEHEIRASFGVGPVVDETGEQVAVINQDHQFDQTKAREVLPPELLKLITEPHLSPKRARKLLPPALYEQCRKPVGQPKIKIVSDDQ